MKLQKELEFVLGRTFAYYSDDSTRIVDTENFHRAAGLLGITYNLNDDGAVTILDMFAFVQGIKEYQNTGIELMQRKSGKALRNAENINEDQRVTWEMFPDPNDPRRAELQARIIHAEHVAQDHFEVVAAVARGNGSPNQPPGSQGGHIHRVNNETHDDAVKYAQDREYVSPNGRNIIVLDGMGGHAGSNYNGRDGAIIGQQQAERIIDDNTFTNEAEARAQINRWIQASQDALAEKARQDGGQGAEGVGFVAMVAVRFGNQGGVLIARIGDGEAMQYNAQRHELTFVGEPKNLMYEVGKIAITSGNLTPQQIQEEYYGVKNGLSNSTLFSTHLAHNPTIAIAGKREAIDETVFSTTTLQPGDILILATDGATERNPLENIRTTAQQVAAGTTNVTQATGALLRPSMTTPEASDDAGTVVMIQMQATAPAPTPPPSGKPKPVPTPEPVTAPIKALSTLAGLQRDL